MAETYDMTAETDEVFLKFLRRIHKYSDSISESDYLFYHDFYEDAQTAVINKRRPYGATDDQKTEALTTFSNIVVRVADYLFSKDGAAGETSHTENGVTRQYGSADIPDSILQSVTPFGDAF